MVVQPGNIYLVTGGTVFQRRKTIDKIKRTILKGKSSELSFTTLHAEDLISDSLKNSALTFSFDKTKIILVKGFTSLKKANKNFLLNNLPKILRFSHLIFESDLPYSFLKGNKKLVSDPFFQTIFAKSTKYEGKAVDSGESSIDLFCRKLYRNNLKECLFIAEELLSVKSKEKIVATQIMGILINKCTRSGGQNKQRSLGMLWDADRALKETNIDARLLIERLLVGLELLKL